MELRPSLRAAVVASLLALAPAAAAQLQLTSSGGGTVNQLSTMTISGPPATQYLLILSLNAGPTVLPPPHQPNLDVGLELIDFSFLLPGFFGFLDGAGQSTALLPVPPQPLLIDLPLHFQAVRVKNGTTISGKSNPWILTPDLPNTSNFTLDDMPVRRAGHTVTPLPDGSLIFIGGGPDGVVASYGQDSVERYVPGTQTFVPLGTLGQPRVSHTATRLLDGRILVAGGAEDVQGEPTATAEVLDPVTGLSTPAGNLSVARALHSASLLPDGRVLIAGGTSSFFDPTSIITSAHKSTEIFDPLTNTFSPGPNLSEPRVGHTATTLQDGTVLLAAGYSWFTILTLKLPSISQTAQRYTPQAGGPGTFTFNGSSTVPMSKRFGHTATRLPDGRVFVAGGASDQGNPLDPNTLNTTEIYDPLTHSFAPAGTLSTPRAAAVAVALQNGDVLVAGGASGTLTAPVAEITIDVIDPLSGSIVAIHSMLKERANFSANLLVDGTLLLAGGGEEVDPNDPNAVLSWDDAEIFRP